MLGVGILSVGFYRWLIMPTKSIQGGQRPSVGSVRYRLNHHETTGLTDYLVLNGKEVAIQFTPDSNPTAVRIVHGWTVPDDINPKWPQVWITGKLLPATHMTPVCEGCSEPERYREFRLEYAEVKS